MRSRTNSSPIDILIVDDDFDIREIAAEFLQEEGFTTMTAESAQSARELLQTREVRSVLSDLWMPGESGLGLLLSLHSAGSYVPFYIMTADVSCNWHGLMATGALRVFRKPFDLRELILELEQIGVKPLASRPAVYGPKLNEQRLN